MVIVVVRKKLKKEPHTKTHTTALLLRRGGALVLVRTGVGMPNRGNKGMLWRCGCGGGVVAFIKPAGVGEVGCLV